MRYFVWSEKHMLGVPAMDAQHQNLFALADRLHTAVIDRKPPAELKRALAALVDGAREHFAAEEVLMAAAGFPELAQHRAEHGRLMERVERLQREHTAGRFHVGSEMFQFFSFWLTHHIEQTDRGYAHWIRQQKAAAEASPDSPQQP